jgi:hypothetical protein
MAFREPGTSVSPHLSAVCQFAGPSDLLTLRRPGRRRLLVISPTVAEAVQHSGGWLFDQVMEGRDVAVLTADRADPRPLQILGAPAYALDAALGELRQGPCLQDIVIQAALYQDDPRVRRMARQTLDVGLTGVLLWGVDVPAGPGFGVGMVMHQLGKAAQAFKAHALAAAGAPAGPVSDAEVFRRAVVARPRRLRPGAAPARRLAGTGGC